MSKRGWEDIDVVAETGWIPAREIWTYSAADAPTFTATTSGDKTSKYSAGMRVKLTQTTVKYFIITAVAYSTGTTTLTLYGGTDYTLANALIQNPYFSTQKAPQGFPLNRDKWDLLKTDTTRRSQTPPASGTWYNLGSASINVPIGAWDIEYMVAPQALTSAAVALSMYVTLSTANNSQSDVGWTCSTQHASPTNLGTPNYRRRFVLLAAKTTYYLNTSVSGTSLAELRNLNDLTYLYIRANCAYI